VNLTKAAAAITLIVALVAAGYLAYEATFVRNKYDAAVLACTNCTTQGVDGGQLERGPVQTSNFSKLRENIGKPENLRGNTLAKSLWASMFRVRIAKRRVGQIKVESMTRVVSEHGLEISRGAPVLALFEKWPSEPPRDRRDVSLSKGNRKRPVAEIRRFSEPPFFHHQQE